MNANTTAQFLLRAFQDQIAQAQKNYDTPART